MPTRETSEIFHRGWPDPDWIRGFSVVIRPLVDLDPSRLQELMTTEEIPEMEPLLARNVFDQAHLSQTGDASRLVVVRNLLHCGTPGSQMHQTALASLNFRLDLLLSEGS